MFTPESRALNKIIHDGRFTAKEIAEEAGCSDKHIYAVRNGDAELKMSDAGRVSRWLCEHGESRLAKCYVGSHCRIIPVTPATMDGSIYDESDEMLRAMATASEAHNEVNVAKMERAIANMRAILGRYEAEKDALK